jgi:hypothetical protein
MTSTAIQISTGAKAFLELNSVAIHLVSSCWIWTNVEQMKVIKRAFECAIEHLHPTKVLEKRANQDLMQGLQPKGVRRF